MPGGHGAGVGGCPQCHPADRHAGPRAAAHLPGRRTAHRRGTPTSTQLHKWLVAIIHGGTTRHPLLRVAIGVGSSRVLTHPLTTRCLPPFVWSSGTDVRACHVPALEDDGRHPARAEPGMAGPGAPNLRTPTAQRGPPQVCGRLACLLQNHHATPCSNPSTSLLQTSSVFRPLPPSPPLPGSLPLLLSYVTERYPPLPRHPVHELCLHLGPPKWVEGLDIICSAFGASGEGSGWALLTMALLTAPSSTTRHAIAQHMLPPPGRQVRGAHSFPFSRSCGC